MFDESEVSQIKVVLIGESGVGKTSIIRQYIDGIFDNNFQSTIGGSFCTKNIHFGKKLIKLEIWDTAGQEKFRSLSKMFYTNSKIVILVFDLMVKTSLEEVKNYWFGKVKETTGDDVVLAVVGNKVDAYDERDKNEDAVEEGEGRKFANGINALYFETSAKNHIQIEDLFKKVSKKYLDTHSSQGENSANSANLAKLHKPSKDNKKKGCC